MTPPLRAAAATALLAACVAPATRPDALPVTPAPLAECELIRSPFRRKYDCPGGAASVSLRPEVTVGPEAWLDEQQGQIQHAEKVERLQLRVGERTLPALRVAVTVEQDGEPRFLDGNLVAEKSEAGLVTADCAVIGRDRDREAFCRDVLPYLLAIGPALKEFPPPVLLGRELAVPAGCEAESSDEVVRGSITCAPEAALSWTLLGSKLEVAGVLNEFIHRFAMAVGRERVQSEPWECRVGGLPATCGHLQVTAEGETLHVFVGVRKEGDEFLIAQCNTSRAEPDHPACSGLIATAK